VKLLRLRQITSGFVGTDDGIKEVLDEGKTALLTELLQDLPSDVPVVVFGLFRWDLDQIHEAAKRAHRTSAELSGRRKELETWQAPDGPPILAAQLASGGVGIDLTRAAYAIYFSVGFNLGEYQQSLARVHRPGQTRPVTYIHLLTKDTVDEKVHWALEHRQNVIETVLKGKEKEWMSTASPVDATT
jgi:SNF2 family DNA or RNA helicase